MQNKEYHSERSENERLLAKIDELEKQLRDLKLSAYQFSNCIAVQSPGQSPNRQTVFRKIHSPSKSTSQTKNDPKGQYKEPSSAKKILKSSLKLSSVSTEQLYQVGSGAPTLPSPLKMHTTSSSLFPPVTPTNTNSVKTTLSKAFFQTTSDSIQKSSPDK